MVSVLRGWGEQAMEEAADGMSEQEQMQCSLIFSSDLKNAYGQIFRSQLLRGILRRAPSLAPLLAQKWCSMGNVVWQRRCRPDGGVDWHRSWGQRGGGQGSRLMI